jgi:nucleotide-binding universal stress UspA family protein
MLNHVLIPLDGSLLAEKALDAAQKILGVNATITLVTAVEMPQMPVYGFDLPMALVTASPQTTVEEAVQQVHTYLEKIAADLRTDGYHVHIHVSVGEAAIVIGEVAEKNHVDAIVICTHGRSGISRWLFGSVTNKVLTTAHCPIYVIPNLQQEKAPQKTGAVTSLVS